MVVCWTDSLNSYAHEGGWVLMWSPFQLLKLSTIDGNTLSRLLGNSIICMQGATGTVWIQTNWLYNSEGLNGEGALVLTFNLFETIDNNIWDIWCKMGPHTLILMHGCNMLGWDEPKLTSILHLEQGKDLDVNQSPFQTSKANNHWCWNVEQIIR